ncbi:hypothetical protein [Anaerotignum sp.]|uniref:hypothetical protein n=1 Tax=Anaerotignum sp. TaxID=2039241 RepID=UPI0028A10166|nr:hypothetical protein [Anaerotignum sp.]
MLDLQRASSDSYEIKWFDGTVLRLQKPSRAMEISFLEILNQEMDERAILKTLHNLAFQIFSRHEPVYVEKKGFLNKLMRKKELLEITKEDVEKISYNTLLELLKEYFDHHYTKLKMGE